MPDTASSQSIVPAIGRRLRSTDGSGSFNGSANTSADPQPPASRHQPTVRLSSFGGLIGIALALAGSLWLSAALHLSCVKVFPVARSFIIY